MLRKKKTNREMIGSTELGETPTSRPFVPAYDPSKEDYGHYNYEAHYAQAYPASETVVSYESPHYSQPTEPMIRNVPDEKDYERHVPDEK